MAGEKGPGDAMERQAGTQPVRPSGSSMGQKGRDRAICRVMRGESGDRKEADYDKS